jgi:hypothetical protein
VSFDFLDPQSRADVQGVADLHRRYLDDSPIVRFGRRFLEKFYYDRLVRDGLVGCRLYRADGKVVGFISYTMEPLGFMTGGMRRHPIALSTAVLGGIVSHPGTIRELLGVLRVMRDRRDDSRSREMEGTAEVLSLVVDAAYGSHVPHGGDTRLAVRLFDEAQRQLRKQGAERVHLLVKPGNIASNLLCSSMGCTFEKIDHGGEPVHRYTYTFAATGA